MSKKTFNAKTDHIDKAWNGQHEAYNADYEKAMKFLDSIGFVESKLKFGGYIQDKNGIPCKHRDKIKIFHVAGMDEVVVTLDWNKNERAFYVEYDDGSYGALTSLEFEKVK